MNNREIAAYLSNVNAMLDKIRLRAESEEGRDVLLYLSNVLDHMVHDLTDDVSPSTKPHGGAL